jgi:hypothetical protein
MHFASRLSTWRVAHLYIVQCTVQWNSSISETVQNRTHINTFLCLEWPILWPPRPLTFPPGTFCIYILNDWNRNQNLYRRYLHIALTARNYRGYWQMYEVNFIISLCVHCCVHDEKETDRKFVLPYKLCWMYNLAKWSEHSARYRIIKRDVTFTSCVWSCT